MPLGAAGFLRGGGGAESVEKCHACLSARRDEGAAHPPAEDKPVSLREMTYLSAAQRISALSVSIIAKGRG